MGTEVSVSTRYTIKVPLTKGCKFQMVLWGLCASELTTKKHCY
jgi:hypothetical protein